MKRPQIKKKQKNKKNNRDGSLVVPCFLTLITIDSTAFYQLNNHYINFSALNGNAKCH